MRAESEKKDGELRKQVPEEGFESEEGWYEMITFILNLASWVYIKCNIFNRNT